MATENSKAMMLDMADQPQNVVVARLVDIAVEILRNGCLRYPRTNRPAACLFEGRWRTLLAVNSVTKVPLGKRMVQLLMLIDMILDAVMSGQSLMLRQLWYMQKGSPCEFSTTKSCYDSVRLICQLTALPRYCLNIYAQCKGVAAGSVLVRTKVDSSSSVATCVDDGSDHKSFIIRPEVVRPGATEVVYVPYVDLASSNPLPTCPTYILVVEKDTVFSRLVESGFHTSENCIMVCGCGSPCLGTRAFLSLVAKTWSDIPVFGLFDYNPYGFGICLGYAHGPMKGEPEAYLYSVPRLKLLGICSRDILDLGHLLTSNRIQLTRNDRIKCESLRGMFTQETPCVNLHQELDFMIAGGYKIELESLNCLTGENSDFMISWLRKVSQTELSKMKSRC